MKSYKKLSSIGAAVLVAASMNSTYAADSEVIQAQTQERVQSEINRQQSLGNAGQNMQINKNPNKYQHKYQYKNMYKNTNQAREAGSGNAKGTGNNADDSGQGSNLYRNKAAQRTKQVNSDSGSMNRQGSANRSMGGGGGRR